MLFVMFPLSCHSLTKKCSAWLIHKCGYSHDSSQPCTSHVSLFFSGLIYSFRVYQILRFYLLAEAKALQQHYGISLKDACHCLYMMETAKLDTINVAEKTMAVIHSCLNQTRGHETLAPITLINKGAFNDYVLPHSKWPRSEEDPSEATVMELKWRVTFPQLISCWRLHIHLDSCYIFVVTKNYWFIKGWPLWPFYNIWCMP